MKKICFTLLLFLSFATCTFADIPEYKQLPVEEKVTPNHGFFYVQFSAGEHNLIKASAPVPGLGIGYRIMAAGGAADLSFSGIGIQERKNSKWIWTAPKASYYHYFQANAEKTFYAGGGIAWGGVSVHNKDSKRSSFVGLIPSATLGYEFVRRSSFLGFSEFTVCQPALPVWINGTFPGPIAELSVGMGF